MRLGIRHNCMGRFSVRIRRIPASAASNPLTSGPVPLACDYGSPHLRLVRDHSWLDGLFSGQYRRLDAANAWSVDYIQHLPYEHLQRHGAAPALHPHPGRIHLICASTTAQAIHLAVTGRYGWFHCPDRSGRRGNILAWFEEVRERKFVGDAELMRLSFSYSFEQLWITHITNTAPASAISSPQNRADVRVHL